jgi:hypothetical protein
MASVLKKLETISFKESFEKELRTIYDVSGPQLWLEKLDEVTYMRIGSWDGVYDFRKKRFGGANRRTSWPCHSVTPSTTDPTAPFRPKLPSYLKT